MFLWVSKNKIFERRTKNLQPPGKSRCCNFHGIGFLCGRDKPMDKLTKLGGHDNRLRRKCMRSSQIQKLFQKILTEKGRSAQEYHKTLRRNILGTHCPAGPPATKKTIIKKRTSFSETHVLGVELHFFCEHNSVKSLFVCEISVLGPKMSCLKWCISTHATPRLFRSTS